MQTKIEKLPKSRIKLTISVPAETVAEYYERAIVKVRQYVEIKGFRKGYAPKALVVERAGNGTILQEMLDPLIPDTYYKVLDEHKEYMPVEQPKVDVKEMKGLDDNILIPLEIIYEAEVDVMPEIKLGDYQRIRIKPKKATEKIDSKELEKTLDELKKVYGDDYLKIGHFADETAMREAVGESLKQQKVLQAESETYDELIEALLKKAKVEVPEAFTHNEIHRMERQIESQAKAYGLTFDDWLEREKKTHDGIHQEWHDQAEKAARIGLILGKIAEEEGIDPTKNDASRLVLEKLFASATGTRPGGKDSDKDSQEATGLL